MASNSFRNPSHGSASSQVMDEQEVIAIAQALACRGA
jgi:hypothetical protein